MRHFMLAAAVMMLCLTGACTGDFDQREEQAETAFPGEKSIGSTANPEGMAYVRGTASIGGAVRTAPVTLRPIRQDGSVDWDDENALGSGFTFENGIYEVTVAPRTYRGPILVEVAGSDDASGGNPATAVSGKFHDMTSGHMLFGVCPLFDGYAVADVMVTPLTTVAVARCLAFDGSIAGVQGGIATGLFGLVAQQVAEFFGLGKLIAALPLDFANSGSFGNHLAYGYVMAALSQLARDFGIANVFDFYLGMYHDALDDGELNGSIGPVPNSGVAMPDLGAGGLIGNALLNNYLDPANAERVHGTDNTSISPGSDLDQLINALDSVRDIDDVTRDFELTVRVPSDIELARGSEFQTRVTVLKRIGESIKFHAFGDSAGPSFVDFAWTSSSPGNVSVQAYGRVTADAGAPTGNYTLTLTIQPRAGQSYITGPMQVHSINVKVR